jgi:two-component system, cell cycle sensor histidine kinase and response regulator CckA
MKDQMMSKKQLILIAAVLSIFLLAGGFLYYRNEEETIREEKYSELHAIAELKAGQITQWVKERKADAGVLSESPFFISAIEEWLGNRNNLTLKKDIVERLIQIKEKFGYEDILIASPQGKLFLSLNPMINKFDPDTSHAIIKAVGTQKISFTNFYFCSTHKTVHLDIIAPVVNENKTTITALVLRVNPNDYLYPLIQYWPTPSDTAETLLVRRDDNSVLFLNELRHKKHAALLLRRPLTEKELVCVKAVTGTEGIVEGKDYRGIAVLADIWPVQGTPWYIIAKVDKNELFSKLYYRTGVIAGFTFLLFVLLVAGMSWFYQYRQKDIYEDLFSKEKSLREAQEEFRTTLYSVGEAVITTDAKGSIRQMNPVAEILTGWDAPDAKGKPLEEVFQILNEETRSKTVNTVQKVLKEGVVFGLANHTLLISKDGKEIPIADSGAPIRNESGDVTGVVLVFRDQTEERMAQKRLLESEQRFRLLYDQSPAPYQSLDEKGNILDVNITWLETLGYEKNEVIGRWFGEFLADNNAALFLERFSQFKSLGEVHGVEFEMKHKDGHTIIVSFEGSISSNKRGDFLQTHCVFTNITERKRVEKELLESEERFRMFIESAPEAIFVQSRGCFVYLNPAMLWLLRASTPEELLGKNFMDQIAPEYHEAINERIRRQRETGQPVPTMEQEYLRLDGLRVPVETTAVAIRFQNQDAHLVFIRDITERKKAEKQLRNLSRVVEQSPASVLITDLQGNIEYINPKFTEVTGYSLEEVRGQNPRILKSGETPPEEYRKLWKTITAGGEWRGVLHNKRKNGTFFWERASISPVRNTLGEITNFIAVKEDITNQKSLEDQFRQAQKMEAVGQLAGGISHDFNNILTAVIGYAHMLKMKLKDDQKLESYADHILSVSERAANLTQSLLAFSRKQIMNPKPTDLNGIIRRTDHLLSRIIGEDIQLQTKFSGEDPIVIVDAGQIEQVLMNLAANARDAMPEGGQLSIETEMIDIDHVFIREHGYGEEGPYVVISVTDTGTGMSSETREKIFEPFFTTKEVGKGTGLGLAMVYGIIKQHEGHITVYSEPGKGTTFRIYLPLIQAKIDEITPEFSAPPETGTETILLAEDDPEVMVFTKQLLEEYGYKVIDAADGDDAIKKFMLYKNKIQLVMLDVIMPKRNGREVYEAVKNIRPDIRVLFASGYPADHINGMIADGSPLITKPVSPTKLLNKIREVLDK